MNRGTVVGFAVLVGVASVVGCKKDEPTRKGEEDRPGQAAPDKLPAAKPELPIAALPKIDLAAAAPSGDLFSILFRFDRLRLHGLAPAAEGILVPLPDYIRVFGGRERNEFGDLIGDVFETVVLTTSDPTLLTASTLAARGRFDPVKLRAMLAFAGSGVSWGEANGGALGTISAAPRFSWDEPRVYLMPAPGWIVLSHPNDLEQLAVPAAGKKSRRGSAAANPPTTAQLKTWPSWLRQVSETDRQSRLSSPEHGDLLVAANIRGLSGMNVPTRFGQFEVPSPKEVTITAFAKDGGVSFHGSMSFDEPPTAEHFVKVARAGKLALDVKEIAKALPPGSLQPLKNLSFYQDGRVVRWQTKATAEETIKMCEFSAQMAARMMGGFLQ